MLARPGKINFIRQSQLIYPLLASSAALFLTILAWYYTTSGIKARDKATLNNFSEQIDHEVLFRMQTYINALEQTKSLFHASEHVEQDEFSRYIAELNLLARYPGIQGIGFTKQVSENQLKDYKVWPTHKRDIYFTIVYLEPLDWRNKRAIGYDMFTEPNRRKAMEAARDLGRPVMTNKVILVQETDEDLQPGFLIYVPLYKGNIPDTVEKRRSELKGFIYAPFRSGDLFRNILTDIKRRNPLGLRVYDGNPRQEALLFDSHGTGTKVPVNPHYLHRSRLNIAGKDMILETFTLPGYSPETSEFPSILLIMGTIISFYLFWFNYKEQLYSRELARLFEEAKEALQARDEFLSIASHELKTPVTSLKLQFQMAQKQLDRQDPKVSSPESVQKRIGMANAQLNRINRLVEDMLDTSRFISNKIQLEQNPLNINLLISEILNNNQEQVMGYKGGVITSLCDGTPMVLGDNFRLEQVLTNLLTNAFKYGQEKPIEISSSVDEKNAYVIFKDQGIGISPENISRIFNRFERAVSGSGIGGLGLGLYISNQIVLAHGGRIDVKSELNKGSTFTVMLPLKSENR